MAARDWTRQHIPPHDLRTGWQDQLTTFLVSAGPLVIRGHDLSFLHHSFAEHLAATAIARTLPEKFDPDDDSFANRLHTARPKETGRHARAVLLHYARLRSTEADPMLRWLHSGTADQHLLAARLFARHLPASTEVVDAFLATVHGWAMTSKYTGDEILHQVCRAAHHPGLVEWLLDLMRSTAVPWRSRVEAAAALVIRLRGEHSAEAITLLSTVVDDAAIPIDHRLNAAEALAQSGAAERDAAERGLRSVLSDPLASGANCRTAAVVLSALGAQARADAVEALMRLVSDPDTPTDDLVEVATGLVEIGFEFHERCAEVFRAALCDEVNSTRGRRDAALGLASLGPQYLSDAVTGLTALITNRRFDRSTRAFAAGVLGELGPQHRLNAGEQLMSILSEPGTVPFERYSCTSHLAQLGPEFKDQTIAHLRSVITDPEALENHVLWATQSLADIGPEFQAEAAEEMWKIYSDPLTSASDRVFALGQLAGLATEPNRQRALNRLRATMLDYCADPMDRCRAAAHLISAGPEFHPEAGKHLRALADSQLDPKVAVKAWRELLNLSTAFHDEAFEALFALMSSEIWDGDIPLDAVLALVSSNSEYIERTSKILSAIQDDDTRSIRTRVSASRGLVRLGRAFHRRAATGLRNLLCSATSVNLDFSYMVRNFTEAGIGIRAQLGQTLRDAVLDPWSPSSRRWHAAQALEVLGLKLGHDVIAALYTIVDDESAWLRIREDAAAALARAVPEHLADAADAVMKVHGERWLRRWRFVVLDLVYLKADVVPRLHTLLMNKDAHVLTRGGAAVLLVMLGADPANVARTELRRHADDQHLEHHLRTNSWQYLIEIDRTAICSASTYHQGVLENEEESIKNRVSAARHLTRLNPRQKRQTFAFLRRVAQDHQLPINERCASAEWLHSVRSLTIDTFEPDVSAVLYDHWVTPDVQRRLTSKLPRKLRTEVERVLLADHSVPIEERLPRHDVWDDLPLAVEAEAEVRDVLTAAEALPAERVAAAAALANLSWRLIPEAIDLLEHFANQECATDQARRKLADMGSEPRKDIQTRAENQVRNESLPRRTRFCAAQLIMDLTAAPPPFVTDFLRHVTEDKQTSDRDRVDALFALRRVDGLDGLRTVRDDEQRPPAARWRAAEKLLDRAVEDRAAGVRILHEIATDTNVRPALRWRVARTLARLGVPGRDRAAAALRTMVHNATLGAATRAEVARVLNDIVPSGRRDVLTLLRDVGTENPLHRWHVLHAISTVDAAGAASELEIMAADEGLDAVVRLRCAELLVSLHRDRREKAAVVARAVAHDKSVSAHVRRHAARDLARWSKLCREEARDLIQTLSPNTQRMDRDYDRVQAIEA